MKSSLAPATFAAIGLTLLSSRPSAFAAFPGLGDDHTPSLGKFELVVNPLFHAFLDGSSYPGWDSGNQRLLSPTLYDPNTVIGRSAPFLAGSPADLLGTPVGTRGTIVSDSSFGIVPPEVNGPAGTREVHTEIASLNLIGGGAAVRAGTHAPGRPLSVGEVESQSPSGNPALDFPASSFFDIFVEVDLPVIGTLYNTTPLVVKNTSLTAFPPKVIYVHGNSSAVPLFFENDNPFLGAHAGDVFGILMLAGHGVNMSIENETELAEFENEVENEMETEVDPEYADWAKDLRVVPEPSTPLVLLAGLVALAATVRARVRWV